jgi:hypothetical protein
MFEDLEMYYVLISALLSFLCSLKYKLFKINILHVCGIHHWLYEDFFSQNFLKLKRMIFLICFLKNDTGAHVHQISIQKTNTN